MAEGMRQTKRRTRFREPLRDLFGKKLYVPIKTGPRRGVSDPSDNVVPEPGPYWPGTRPEWAIYWAHLTLDLLEGRDFIYRLSSYATDNIEVDFLELSPSVGIQVQGEFWHYEFRSRAKPRDIQQKARLEAQGMSVIWIDENAALTNPVFFLQEALRGRDHSQGQGF